MTTPRFGVGFRSRHFDEIVAALPAVDWLEIVADNFIGVGGTRRAMLERLRADYPVALHGVSLSIAASEPLRDGYVDGLRALADELDPVWVSDHLCWTAFGGRESHDLLPIAHTREVLAHVAERVERVQDRLGRRLLLENATAYVAFRQDEMDEAAFFAELCRRTGCGMLLDVNNLYVNAENLGVDPGRYLTAIPPDAVGYLHLAGHAVLPDVRIDTHDADVPSEVWDLFAAAVRRFPDAGVIVERDDALPPFASLAAEAANARRRHALALATPVEPIAREDVRAERPGAPAWSALQADLWTRLVDKPLRFDHTREPGLDALLDDRRPVRAARGLRVYSDAYTASLRRALATNFPALARVVSTDDFDRLAAAYLQRHPPVGYEFRSLGRELAAFVRSFPFARDYGVAPDVLGDLAALEQAELEVLDDPDEPGTVAPSRLAAIAPDAWEGARFRFARALRIVRAGHDVLPVVEAVGRDEDPPRPAAGPVAYLVCRPGGRLRTERLRPEEAVALEALLAGRTFGEACAAARRPHDTDAEIAREGARTLVDASARGLIAAIEPGGA